MSDLKGPFLLACLLLLPAACTPIRLTDNVAAPEPGEPALTELTDLDTDTSESATTAEVVLAADAESPERAAEVLTVAEPMQEIVAEQAPATIDLWSRLRAGMQLDHSLHEKRVQQELAWYARHPAYLDRVADRSNRYLYYIVDEVRKRGMPMEVALLPVVESAFDPFAYSHGRAMGLWQFIPSTARLYGLKIDWWYDGRRDVVASTQAALDYLQALHKSLDGDWLLALAAYNSGEGNVRKAIRRNQRRGKPIDFWSLDLLPETSAYVPRLLAISSLVKAPEQHDITLKSIPDSPFFQIVDIQSQLDLAKAAQLAELEAEQLYLLNPAYNRWSTHPEGPHRLLLPIEKADTFSAKLAEFPVDQRVAWQRHKIRSGESLGQLASRYNTTVEVIRQANEIRGNMIRAGDSLMIPVAAYTRDDYALSEDQRDEQRNASLSERYGTSPLRYTVRPGDSLWTISRAHGVSHRTLAKWNGMAPRDPLMAGRELFIWNRQEITANQEIPDLISGPEVIRKVNYRVRNGESLSLIAAKFRVSVADIQRWNPTLRKKRYIHPGDRLALFIDVTNGS